MYCYVGSRSPPFGDGQKSRYSFSVKMEVIIMKKFFRCIFNMALGIMFVTAFILLFPGLFGIRPYVVYSGSMEPEIQTGAVVFTKVEKLSPEKGDIITFRNGDTVITHRVIKKQNGTGSVNERYGD